MVCARAPGTYVCVIVLVVCSFSYRARGTWYARVLVLVVCARDRVRGVIAMVVCARARGMCVCVLVLVVCSFSNRARGMCVCSCSCCARVLVSVV